MRVVVVGAGGTTRDLLRGLGEVWDAVVVETDPERLAQAEKVRDIQALEGDGSSRVVLQRAGLAEADALVAATNSDEVNLEACRLAQEAGVLRVVAVAADPERLGDYRELGVAAFSPDRLTARRLEITLEPRRVASAAFADGMAEAIEFRISSDSPLRGRALQDLHAETWLVAAISRDGRLIVPHGESVLQAGDLVTVVGAAADYATIVATFTGGEARFPIDFGKQVAVALERERDLAGAVAEAANLTRNSSAETLLLVHRSFESIRDDGRAAELRQALERVGEFAEGVEVRVRPIDQQQTLASVAATESVGVMVVPRATGGRAVQRPRFNRLLRAARDAGVSLLLAGGTHPYEQVVVPARDTPAGRAAARAAIDLAAYGKSRLLGVAVVPPAFIAGDDARHAALRAMARLREEAAVHGVTVRRRIRQGNPVAVMTEVAGDRGLLVLGMPGSTPTWFTPGILGHLAERVACSILLVPPQD